MRVFLLPVVAIFLITTLLPAQTGKKKDLSAEKPLKFLKELNSDTTKNKQGKKPDLHIDLSDSIKLSSLSNPDMINYNMPMFTGDPNIKYNMPQCTGDNSIKYNMPTYGVNDGIKKGTERSYKIPYYFLENFKKDSTSTKKELKKDK